MAKRIEPPPTGKPTVRVLVLNASLKHRQEFSNTEDLAELVLEEMSAYKEVEIKSEMVRLADLNLEVGVMAKGSEKDQWPGLSKKVQKSDIVIFATPIWWGARSSLMQRVIERMDAFDEQYIHEGKNLIYNKVAGIVITGSEDGAMSTMAHLMLALTWFGFTLPPECGAYWVGEVGMASPDVEEEAEKRRESEATQKMARKLAGNLLYYALLLRQHPLDSEEEPRGRRSIKSKVAAPD